MKGTVQIMEGEALTIREENDERSRWRLRPAARQEADAACDRPGWFARWLRPRFYACGEEGPPAQIEIAGASYTLRRILKHDFWAATALYEAAGNETGRPRAVVFKHNRRRPFGLVPLGWLGRLLTHNEVCNLGRCADVPGVPKVVTRLGPNTFVYEYIEGTSLRKGMVPPADFFDRLRIVLDRVHARRLVHLDLHKPGNILLGRDGRAYLIDFQISTCIPDRLLISPALSSRFRRWLQSFDIYHLYKHKRRLLPERLTKAEYCLSHSRSLALMLHRVIVAPYKWVRRATLRYLFASGMLKSTPTAAANAETDPARWTHRPPEPARTADRIPIVETRSNRRRKRSGGATDPVVFPGPSEKSPDLF